MFRFSKWLVDHFISLRETKFYHSLQLIKDEVLKIPEK